MKPSSKAIEILLPFIFLVAVILSINIGPYEVGPYEILRIIVDGINHVPRSDNAFLVIWRIRLPRTILAVVTGIGLAICGTIMQNVLDNPMASPFTLGISSGASFGAALAILLQFYFIQGTYFIVFNAFIFALITSVVVFTISSRYNASPETMILTGIGLSFLFSALTILLEYFSSPEAVYNLQFWIHGSLGKATWEKIGIISIIQILAIPILYWKALNLDIMAYGEDQATSLGINVKNTRILSAGLVSIIAASIVCFTGVIGFIGLVSPHIIRIFLGNNSRKLIIFSGITGAALLLFSDIVSSLLAPPLILPIGAITSLIGAPFFLYLIQKRRRFGNA
jgi:iron complex transport system permease protein